MLRKKWGFQKYFFNLNKNSGVTYFFSKVFNSKPERN